MIDGGCLVVVRSDQEPRAAFDWAAPSQRRDFLARGAAAVLELQGVIESCPLIRLSVVLLSERRARRLIRRAETEGPSLVGID